MSKTNDTSKLDHAKLENRMLADSELNAVSGGDIATMLKGLHDMRSASSPLP
jgi:hypothetical protein